MDHKLVEQLSLEIQRLGEELHRDELTGLRNARSLKKDLKRFYEAVERGEAEVGVLFVDLDHFKSVNEEHGHLAASELLKKVGELIKNMCCYDELAFRYAGDEFVLLLRGTESKVRDFAENLRSKIERELFQVEGHKGTASVKITASLGMRMMDVKQSPEKILEAADRALFEAKRRSRNRLVAA